MKESSGVFRSGPTLKSLSNKLGCILCRCNPPNKYKELDSKLQKRMVEVKRGAFEHSSIRSIDSIILRFPRFKEEVGKIRGVFEQHDVNGTIDSKELMECLKKLQLHHLEKEVQDLLHLYGSEGIKFNEFILLLCLIYLLVETPTANTTSKMGSPQLEATISTIVEAFLFLDKNGDGKLNRKDLVKALNEASRWERSPAHITKTRFKEMDRNRDGEANFREFVFTFINWVGADSDEDIPVT